MSKKNSILVVDDNPKNLQVLANLLADKYKLFLSESAKSAIEIVNTKKIDLVLLDVIMPDMNGFETCKVIKANPTTTGIPIIFITAKVDVADITNGFKCGGVDYVTKPFNHDELLARIETHLKLKTSQELLELKNYELQKLVETRNKFFSIISHDLRNPITALSGVLTILKNDYFELSEKEKIELIDSLFSSSTNLKNLLENLLQWAKTQTKKIVYEPESINLDKFFSEIVEIVKLQAKQKKIKIIIRNMSLNVYADVKMLRTVFLNIISNAIKYTNNSGSIELTAENIENFILIKIADNGIGMTDEQISNIAKVESNSSTLGTQGEKGTGLGLIICKEYIDINKGKIEIQSQKNIGTTITLKLPKVKNETTS